MTAVSPSYPRHHREAAETVVDHTGMAHRFIETHEMRRPDYRKNAGDRCYHCKSELFEGMEALRRELGFESLAYGINLDDRGDHRPGHRAAAERDVLAPLLQAGLGKEEIRQLARAAGLPTADLPASACLASRLPYGTEVTAERLAQVEAGEAALRELGFEQLRIRHHGDVARIEIAPEELPRALSPEMAARMVEALRPVGFRFVTLDLEGYRQGSLNVVLTQSERVTTP